MSDLPFLKMHGLGNDFVVVDARAGAARPWHGTAGPDRARLVARLADRRRGIGCDQFIVIEDAARGGDAAMVIHNADGGPVAACGNASRCVAALLMAEAGAPAVTLETAAGSLDCTAAGDGLVRVDMGPARLAWQDIPVTTACDTTALPLDRPGLPAPVGVNMGNPHAVFLVDAADRIDPAAHGPGVERDPLFPERANVEFVSVMAPGRLRMRVWERGVGITRACGTGACAAAVATHRLGVAGPSVTVVLDGGPLAIEWLRDGPRAGHVLMTGPVATSYRGVVPAAVLEGQG